MAPHRIYVRALSLKRALCLIMLMAFFASARVSASPDWLKEVIAKDTAVQVDSRADAVVLYHVDDIKVSKNGKTERKVRKAAKVFSAVLNVEDILAEALSSTREIDDIKGWLITPEGKEIELDDKSIVKVGVPQSYGYYTDASVIQAGFEDVKAGDIVAYEYKIKEDPTWDGYYQSFIFQDRTPVVYAALQIDIPDGWQMFYSAQNYDSLRSYRTEKRHVWEARNLPFVPDEPYSPSDSRLRKMFYFSCFDPEGEGARSFKNWIDVSAWVQDIYRDVCVPSKEAESLVNQLFEKSGDTTSTIFAIGGYVQSEVRYVAVEIGQGRFVPRAAAETFKNKYGDCKDKTTLMIAMLRAAGVESYPALVNTEREVDSMVPTPFQFNHSIICMPVSYLKNPEYYIEAITDGLFFFDPTDASIPMGMLPRDLHGAKALVGWPGEAKLMRLPRPGPAYNGTKYTVNASLNGDNSIGAHVRISDYRGRAEQIRYYRRITSPDELRENLLDRFAGAINNITLDNIAYGDDNDSVWVEFDISGSDYLINAGNLSLFKANFLDDDDIENISSDERVNPFYFGRARVIETDIKWTLPPERNATLDFYTLADTVSIASQAFNAIAGDGTLNINHIVTYTGETVPPSQLEEMKGFIQGLISVCRLRALLK